MPTTFMKLRDAFETRREGNVRKGPFLRSYHDECDALTRSKILAATSL